MSKYKQLLSVIFAVLLGLAFYTPAAAAGNEVTYTGNHSQFLGIIDFGQVTNYPGTPYPHTIRRQKVLYVNAMSDARVTGLDVDTYSVDFNQSGSGKSFGTSHITAGTWTSDANCNPVAGTICYTVFIPTSSGIITAFYRLTPLKKACVWEGVFTSQLEQFGQQFPSSLAVLYGSGKGCDDLLTRATATNGAVTGTIYKLR